MKIIGAGMSGLLAARFFPNSKIIEKQEALPNNHSALLRFRTENVSRLTGIPFKKVMVRKALIKRNGELTDSASLRDANVYSLKVTGEVADRSIISLAPGERWIAPPNFISQLADYADIEYCADADLNSFRGGAVISTIPMPALMGILGFKYNFQFNYRPIWVVNCELMDVDVYQTVYIPYQDSFPYRVTITGNKFTVEFAFQPEQEQVKEILQYLDKAIFDGKRIPTDLMFLTIKKQTYGKIVPVEAELRQSFIMWATDHFNVYSLGRFAVWRPILLDDLVQDLQSISDFLKIRNRYQRHTQGVKT
jgi:hypothetical protein